MVAASEHHVLHVVFTNGTHQELLDIIELAVAHQPNEYVPVADLVRAVKIYEDTALTLLGEGRLPDLET